ncbi:hypothetical protein PUN28_013185 [Cardiocondyla obscurior]|uniref:Uncharacterized protein n=1 Tax=Cardiocondyla obscurior TaxID=286306 RepID=A0AAW2F7G1_9HYME
MSSKRRRAYNFTNSLTGYHQEINNEEINQVTQALSENKLDYIKYKQDEENKCRNLNDRSQESIILAGHTAKRQHPFLANSCNITEESISDETSYLSDKPDLNKCIDLFQNTYVSRECSFEEASNIASEVTYENINICDLSGNKAVRQNISKRQRSASLESLKTVIKQELVRSKSDTLLKKWLNRDTNHNIKFNQIASSPEIAIKHCNERIEIVSSFNAPTLSHRKDNYTIENDNIEDSNDISSKEDFDFLELSKLLQLIKDQNSVKQSPIQHHLLRRLSVDCQSAPRRFTEKLLTIIEESVINDNSFQYSDISLRRFREHLQEITKLIEDETVPEWPQSPDVLTSTRIKEKTQEIISKSLAYTTQKNLCSPSISSRYNIKSPKKLHRHKSENTLRKDFYDSTYTFESLEAFCKALYPDEFKTFSSREENHFRSQSMDDIWKTCKNQMASLEESFNIYEEIQKAKTNSTNLANQSNIMPKVQNLEHKLMPHDKFDRTIMYEIAQKRQRCITTAKTLINIDAHMEKTMDKAWPQIAIDEPSVAVTDRILIAVLSRVKNYQDYLEKYKSYLLQEKLNKSYCEQENVQAEKVLNDNFGKCTLSHLSPNKKTLHQPKVSPNKMNTSPSSAENYPRKTDVQPRLFLTPGKLPVRSNSGYRPTGKYFSNLSPRLNKGKQLNMNVQAGKIYSQMGNYDHVVSPVGMYIKGAPLKKNEPPKTNEMLISSKEKQTT